LGFTHAWFYDTQLLTADVFVAPATAAMQTSRIRLCTGVLIPSNRIAPVAASVLASLNALAPGRIHFGIGTGFTARRTMGLRAITLARLSEYVRVVQGLLNGERSNGQRKDVPTRSASSNPELELINLHDPIPVEMKLRRQGDVLFQWHGLLSVPTSVARATIRLAESLGAIAIEEAPGRKRALVNRCIVPLLEIRN